MLRHIIASDPDNYQPANTHFGLFDPQWFENVGGLKKDELRKAMSEQTKENFARVVWLDAIRSDHFRVCHENGQMSLRYRYIDRAI